jgi:hypothetical protein
MPTSTYLGISARSSETPSQIHALHMRKKNETFNHSLANTASAPETVTPGPDSTYADQS